MSDYKTFLLFDSLEYSDSDDNRHNIHSLHNLRNLRNLHQIANEKYIIYIYNGL